MANSMRALTLPKKAYLQRKFCWNTTQKENPLKIFNKNFIEKTLQKKISLVIFNGIFVGKENSGEKIPLEKNPLEMVFQ